MRMGSNHRLTRQCAISQGCMGRKGSRILTLRRFLIRENEAMVLRSTPEQQEGITDRADVHKGCGKLLLPLARVEVLPSFMHGPD